jgi:electron transport complex protein RnfB
MGGVILAALFLGALGALLAALLIVVSKRFAVEEDPRMAQVAEVLPQYNCGGCGFPGCAGFARHMVETRDPDGFCPPGGMATKGKIASLLGMEVKDSVPLTAQVRCRGSNSMATREGLYVGVPDCLAADLVLGGDKVCPFGCLGLGSCSKACQFDAIRMVDGLAIINEDKCVACKKCVAACPRGIIAMLPKGQRVVVDCNSKDRGVTVKAYCKVGCYTCLLCVKKCPEKAISLVNELIVIDQDKCTRCGICIGVCPQKTINGYHGVEAPPPEPKATAATTANLQVTPGEVNP